MQGLQAGEQGAAIFKISGATGKFKGFREGRPAGEKTFRLRIQSEMAKL